MEFKLIFFLLSIFFISCQNTNKKSEAETVSGEDPVLRDSIDPSEKIPENPAQSKPVMALTSNALQLVKRPSGSTTELPVGMEMDKILEIVSNVLEVSIPELQVNSECGAGPMTMAIFENGLVLNFQKAKGKEEKMEFVGWSVSDRGSSSKLTTMANVGIGSTRAELESAYNVEVKKTSLGFEFSTVPGGLYGIIDGPSENNKINFMWSRLSCNSASET